MKRTIKAADSGIRSPKKPVPFHPAKLGRKYQENFTPEAWRYMQSNAMTALMENQQHQSGTPSTNRLYLRRPWNHFEVTVAAWTRTKGIYRFDQSLRERMACTSQLEISSAALRRLPEQCIYIEIEQRYNEAYTRGPEADDLEQQLGHTYVNGAFFHLLEPGPELAPPGNFVIHCLIMTSTPTERVFYDCGFDFHDEHTVASDFHLMTPAGEAQQFHPAFATQLMECAAYLCSGEAAIRNEDGSPIQPDNTRKNSHVQRWNVGCPALA